MLTVAELLRLGRTLRQLEGGQGHDCTIVHAARLSALSGINVADLAKLKWSDVSFETGSLQLFIGGAVALRSVDASVLNLLRAISKNSGAVWVLSKAEQDGPPSIESMERAWTKIRKVAQLNNLSLHDLPHLITEMSGSSFETRRRLVLALTSRYLSWPVGTTDEVTETMEGWIEAVLTGYRMRKSQ